MSPAEAMESGPRSPKSSRDHVCGAGKGWEVSSDYKETTGTQPLLRSRPGLAETRRHSDGFECLAKDKMKQPDSSLLKHSRM